jgi:hypothetical protein
MPLRAVAEIAEQFRLPKTAEKTKENPQTNHRQTAKNTELVVPNSIQLHPV